MSEKKIIPMTPKSKIKKNKDDTVSLSERFFDHEQRLIKLEDDKALVLELKDQVGDVMEAQSNLEKNIKSNLDNVNEKIDGIKDYLKNEIKGLDINSKSFRRWLVGTALALIITTSGAIWQSLDTGLGYYREDKKGFEKKIELKVDRMQESVEESIDKFEDKLDSKLDNLIDKIIESTKK